MTRERVAVACMATGVPVGSVGVYLVAGLGAALIVLAACLVALAILLGWEE